MAIPLFPPSREAGLLAWSANFNTKIGAAPVDYGLTAGQATAYGVLHTAFATAYAAAADASTNSSMAIAEKRTAKENLLNGPGGARELVAIVQAFPGTTDAERTDLRIRIRDVEPTPVPPPSSAPVLTILSTLGRNVKIRLRDITDPDRRGLPPGVDGASVLTYVGETAPEDPMSWALAMNTTKTTLEVEMPMTVPIGSKVWFTAFWFNQRKASGPAAAFQYTNISGGLAAAA